MDGKIMAHQILDGESLPVGLKIKCVELLPLKHEDHVTSDELVPEYRDHFYRITKKSFRGHWLAEYENDKR